MNIPTNSTKKPFKSHLTQEEYDQLVEAKDQESRNQHRTLKCLQDEIWQIKQKEHVSVSCTISPFKAEEIRGLANIVQHKSEVISRLQQEQYLQGVNKDKMVVLERYQEYGVEVYDAYSRYLQSENCHGLKDLPKAYKRLGDEFSLLVEHKRLQKRALEQDKQSLDSAIADMRKQIEVSNKRLIDYYYLLIPIILGFLFLSFLGSNINTSFVIEAVRIAQVIKKQNPKKNNSMQKKKPLQQYRLLGFLLKLYIYIFYILLFYY